MMKWLSLPALAATLAALMLSAVSDRVTVRQYTIESDAITSPVRLAVLTDLHGCDYGQDGVQLLALLTKEQPDAILMAGDMFSPDGDASEELAFFRRLTDIAPGFYVTGNHEYAEYNVSALTKEIRQTGVTVLNKGCVTLSICGQTVNICGIPDPISGSSAQASLSALDVPEKGYTVLLSHRPELIDQYAASSVFDLVVSGHAHGGQVRIPLLVNGLYAPNQGWFPAYAGGRYDVDSTTMIVSRGLARQRQWYIPRVFNRPEVVITTIE